MRKPKVICALIACAFSCRAVAFQAAPFDPRELERILAKAVEAHQSGELNQAIAGYTTFLRSVPDRPDVLSNLGAAYARLGRYQDAIEQYDKALRLDPTNPAYRFNLALAYYKSAQLDRASAEFSQVLALQPNHRNAHILLADCYFQMGENKKVIELLSPLESKYKDDKVWIYLLGTALIRDGQVEKGQVLVDRILSKGDSAEARLMMGTARTMARDLPGALEEFRRAAELNPQLPSVHSFYGSALMATGNPQKAREAFREELEINPNDYQANLYLGVLLKQEQRYEEALGYLQHALLLRPSSAEVKYQLGTLHLSTGKITQAQEVLEEVVKEAPDFVEAHVSLATVYYRLKRKEEGDRHRRIVEQLHQERQAGAPGAQDQLGPAYRGESTSRVPKPPAKEEPKELP